MEDELLRRLAEAAREDDEAERTRFDDRWDALSAEALDPAAEAELRREAERAVEAAQAYEAFRPLGPEFRARMVEVARTGLASRGGPTKDATAGQARSEPQPASTFGRSGARRRRWLPWSLAAASLAAAGLLVALWPGPGSPALPAYSARLHGSVQELRSPEPPPTGGETAARFVPGNAFELVLTPECAVEGRVAVAPFTEQGGRLLAWPAPVEISPQGAVRIAGRVGDEIRLPPGRTTLVVVLGRPGSLPSESELLAGLAADDSADGAGWTAWRLRVDLEEER